MTTSMCPKHCAVVLLLCLTGQFLQMSVLPNVRDILECKRDLQGHPDVFAQVVYPNSYGFTAYFVNKDLDTSMHESALVCNLISTFTWPDIHHFKQ